MITNIIPEIPTLTEFDNWVRWEYNKAGKKPPLQVNGKLASPTDPRTWSSYEAVKHFPNIGFMFTKDSGLTGIDIDHCRDPETGELSELALNIIDRFTWTWIEPSPSGTGVHIIAGGLKPEWCTECKIKFPDGQIVEIYDHNHYFTFTGKPIRDVNPFAIPNRQDEINELCYELFWEKASEKGERKNDVAPVEELGLDDQEILDKLFSFSNGEKIKDLYEGNWEKHYPGKTQSEADEGFCCYLAWMRCSEDTIDRIVSSSGLYRAKWDIKDYKARTINRAIDSVDEFYSGKGSKVNETIEKMFFSTLLHPFKFKNSVDPLVLSGILEIAHNRGSYIKDGYLKISTSQRDVTLIRNIPQRTVSDSVIRLEEQGYFSVIDKGDEFIASTYAIPISPYLNSNVPISIPKSDDPIIKKLLESIELSPHTPHTVFTVMSGFLHFLSFNSLNPAEIRAILMIVSAQRISINELKNVMRYRGRKNNFIDDVVKPLKKLGIINYDPRPNRFIKLRLDWIDNLLETYDEEELKKVIKKVEEDRRNRDERCLAKPLEEIRRDIELMESMGWITVGN